MPKSRSKRHPARGARAGFTLIELLVVVVIIGILASVALPSFASAQDRARNASMQSNVKVVQVALTEYSAEYNGLHPEVTYVAAKRGGGGGKSKRKRDRDRRNRGAGAPLDGLEDYLPDGELPCSPWCDESQTMFYQPSSGLTSVEKVSENEEIMTPIGRRLGKGSVGDPPTQVTHYGSIAYDLDINTQIYVVYGAGKKNKDAVLTGSASNNGN